MALQRNLRAGGAIALALACAPAMAEDFSSIRTLPQSEFRALSEDLGAAFAYRGITPATPLGVLGFDVGVGLTSTSVEHSSALQRAGAGSRSTLLIPKLHVHKGLFGRLDVGAFVGGATQVDATLYGLEVRYAFIDDTLTTPALGLRLAGTRTSGTGDLRFTTGSADLVISKKLAVVTPYAGGGVVRVSSKVSGSFLEEERFDRTRAFIGVNLNLLAANLALEAEKMGDNTSLSAKLGWRF